MTIEDDNEQLIEAPSQPENGPGHLLVKKREALGMSVQEVADALHITMHYVRALETDDHDKLPGDVFIKGYLRSYASLLQLDPTVIINVYVEYSSERAHEEQESFTRRRRKRNIPWIAVSGVAFVVVALALWFFSAGGSASGSTAAAAGVANTRALSLGGTATIDEVATTLAVPSTPEPDLQVEPSQLLPQERRPAELGPLDQNAEPIGAPVIEPQEQGLESTIPSAAQPPVAAVPERLIAIDGGGQDLVQITFTGASMVQVDDANDEQLYRDVRAAGDVLRISGTAPFNILLGDASNSELSFNGAKVDFSENIRIDNSARLTIGL